VPILKNDVDVLIVMQSSYHFQPDSLVFRLISWPRIIVRQLGPCAFMFFALGEHTKMVRI